MIELYTWTTPNGRKPAIMLEELGLDYEVHPVDLGKDEQKDPAFLKISPNGKIPAIIDRKAKGPDGKSAPRAVFESGAILIYLAEKAGSPLLPERGQARSDTLAWTFFQVGHTGPMFGQLGYFAKFAEEKVPHAIDRYTREAHRLIGVLDERLGKTPYLAGEDYTIADIIHYPWVAALDIFKDVEGLPPFPTAPNLDRWMDRVGAREAVRRGMDVPKVS